MTPRPYPSSFSEAEYDELGKPVGMDLSGKQVVVVVLPLVPVTARMGTFTNREASSISPITGMFRSRAV